MDGGGGEGREGGGGDCSVRWLLQASLWPRCSHPVTSLQFVLALPFWTRASGCLLCAIHLSLQGSSETSLFPYVSLFEQQFFLCGEGVCFSVLVLKSPFRATYVFLRSHFASQSDPSHWRTPLCLVSKCPFSSLVLLTRDTLQSKLRSHGKRMGPSSFLRQHLL